MITMHKPSTIEAFDANTVPEVTVVVLNWNGYRDTLECLESLEAVDYPCLRVLVVDNGSTDGSVDRIRMGFPEIEVLEIGRNLGFTGGNNAGITRALDLGTDYVLLLNNDTIVDPDFLERIVAVGESEEVVGILGPTIFEYSDKDKIQTAANRIDWYRAKCYIYSAKRNRTDQGLEYCVENVDCISGCAIMAKAELFQKLGLLIDDYFAYWEDAEFCTRAKRSGYMVASVPESVIWHKGSVSSKKVNGFMDYHYTRNRFWFMRCYASRMQYFCFLMSFMALELTSKTAIFLFLHRYLWEVKNYYRGILDGIKQKIESIH
jgi:GT2 family glycosyltransferase